MWRGIEGVEVVFRVGAETESPINVHAEKKEKTRQQISRSLPPAVESRREREERTRAKSVRLATRYRWTAYYYPVSVFPSRLENYSL